MGIAKVKKMTKQKQVSTAPKTAKRWSPYQDATDILVTGAAGSSESKKDKSSSLGLRALNDYVIVEEEQMEITQADDSGLTKNVTDALKSGLLVLPEEHENFAMKFPFRGKVISKGPLCKDEEVKIGSRVIFSRMGGMRWERDGKQIVNLREQDLHAVLD